MKTSDFAKLANVLPESIRSSYYRHGHYLGVKPRRLPNGRLDWLDAEVLRLFQGKGGEPSKAA